MASVLSARLLLTSSSAAAHPRALVGHGDALVVNDGGIGHALITPYFTAQNGNATLISLVNTDLANGKALKVRFRGASNSDDILDFTS